MSDKEYLTLRSILEAIDKIERFVQHIKTAEDLLNDDKSYDAILMNFIVIGEAEVNKILSL